MVRVCVGFDDLRECSFEKALQILAEGRTHDLPVEVAKVRDLQERLDERKHVGADALFAAAEHQLTVAVLDAMTRADALEERGTGTVAKAVYVRVVAQVQERVRPVGDLKHLARRPNVHDQAVAVREVERHVDLGFLVADGAQLNLVR